jgi:alkane 1-monooxygenase
MDMKKVWVNLQYFFNPAMVVLALVGIIKGGTLAWLGVMAFTACVVFDTLFRIRTTGAGYDNERDRNYLGIPALLNGMMYATPPVFIMLQIALAWRVYQYAAGVPIGDAELLGMSVQNGITGWQLVGATLSTGIWQGMGIAFGHELSHTKGFSFTLSRWIMALSGQAAFSYAHVYNHHLELGDEVDAATSPRGRSLYAHFLYSHFGQSEFSKRMEEERLAKLNKGFWTLENRWLRGFAMSVPTVALFSFAGGWIGVGIMFIVWVICNFELESLNYMEHYGLIRIPGQPIEYRHSWDSSTMLTSWAFIEIGRQGDHHDRGETHFWELVPTGSPDPGFGYFTEFVLCLIPPLFHSIMKNKLGLWDRDYATPDERKAAEIQNRMAGYRITEADLKNAVLV